MSRDPDVVRVATYNLHALKDDPAALTRVVQALAPDVLAVQEAPRHPFSSHRIATLAARFGLTWAGGSRGGTSTTVMTSLRVAAHATWRADLPTPRWSEPRGYAAVRVSLPGTRSLTVVGTHLGLPGADRVAQTAALLRDLQQLPGPLVVGGDVNERAGGPVWTALGRDLVAAPDPGPTFPAAGPDRQIDGLWHSPELTVHLVDPADRCTPGDLVSASDHLPVVIDVRL